MIDLVQDILLMLKDKLQENDIFVFVFLKILSKNNLLIRIIKKCFFVNAIGFYLIPNSLLNSSMLFISSILFCSSSEESDERINFANSSLFNS